MKIEKSCKNCRYWNINDPLINKNGICLKNIYTATYKNGNFVCDLWQQKTIENMKNGNK